MNKHSYRCYNPASIQSHMVQVEFSEKVETISFNNEETRVVQLLVEDIHYESPSLINFAEKAVKRIIADDIKVITYIARQGTFYENLFSGYMHGFDPKHNWPIMSHLSACTKGGFRYPIHKNSPDEGVIKALCPGIRGNKLFVDHISDSGSTKRTLLNCSNELDPHSNWEMIFHGSHSVWDWRYNPKNNIRFDSPHVFKKAPRNLVYSGKYYNPSPVIVTENPLQIKVYKTISKVLWDIGYDAGKKSLG